MLKLKKIMANEVVKCGFKKIYQYVLPVSVKDVVHADEEELTAKS